MRKIFYQSAIILLLLNGHCFALNSTKSPSACTDHGTWSNCNSADGDGSGAATCGVSTNPNSMDHYTFGFTITTGSTIDGILVASDLWWSDGSCSKSSYKEKLSWNGGSTWTSQKTLTNSINTSETTRNLGGATDTWGRTWTVSEINTSSNFQVNSELTSSSSCIAGIGGDTILSNDWIRATVYYTEPAVSTDYLLYGEAVNKGMVRILEKLGMRGLGEWVYLQHPMHKKQTRIIFL